MEYKKGLMFLLIIVNIIFSAYLISTYYGSPDTLCLTGSSCKTVQYSEYAKIAGIPLAWIGLIAFLALLAVYYLTYHHKINKRYFLSACILASLSALYFIYLQIFKIQAICSNCFIVDSITILIALIAFYTYK